MTTQRVLVDLLEQQRQLTVTLPWPWEIERWVELLIAVLVVAVGDARRVRHLASELTYNVVGGVDEWAALTQKDAAHDAALEAFRSHGWSTRKAAAQIRVVSRLAGALRADYQGYIQRVLRKHCERLRDEVSDMLRASGLSANAADGAATLWLQNVLSAPLPLKTPAVAALMKKHRITARQWLDEADALGINVAILDDVVDAASTQPRRRSSPAKRRS